MVNFELSTGLISAAVLHASFFIFAQHPSPPRADFVNGLSTIEVNLVTAVVNKVVEERVFDLPETAESDPEELNLPSKNEKPAGNPQYEIEAEQKEQASVVSEENTSIPWVEPHYLVNPPPVYPSRALFRGWEGQVMLLVDIDAEGRTVDARIESSSGYAILDNAALNAVKQWVFVPAVLNDAATPSRSRIPVRFLIGG